jgi:mannose-6-phosphate isomerase-like protein (cupin superfamily)
MTKAKAVSIHESLCDVPFLPDRKPVLGGGADAFTQLADYRNGGIWVGHYAGNSEWERHPNGDEIVQILEGETTLVLLLNNQEVKRPIKKGQLMVVPVNVWHRFETAHNVTVLTVTPQPSNHQIERPEG